MKRQRWLWVVTAVAIGGFLVAGDLRAGIVSDILDQAREQLGPVILASDMIVEPGQEVTLSASLRSGLKLEGIESKRLQFILDGKVLSEVRTNNRGDVVLKWKVPEKAGNSVFTVRLNPADQPEHPVNDATLLVAARPKDAPLVIVDLDRTVVASGFAKVLLGTAKPMDGAAVVLQRIAKQSTVVYLTYRPDFLGPASKEWLADNGFPAGPVLTSNTGSLVVGSGTYKNTRLAELRKTYTNITTGIGDKLSDAKTYADSGLKSLLLLQIDWTETDPKYYERMANDLAALPDTVHVVTNWAQVSACLLDKTAFPKAPVEKRLRDLARELRSRSAG
jgi:hypothetical protein